MKKISIAIITYNQEQYIEQAIQSILQQEFTDSYEIVIGEDASTDKTPDIIKKYALEYPNIVKPIIREQNLGMKENVIQTILACDGEYLAILEGDDYWIDSQKLQKQISYLEENEEYVATYHQCKPIDENGNRAHFDTTYVEHEDYTLNDLENFLIPGQTSSAVVRNIWRGNDDIVRLFRSVRYSPLDRMVPLFLLQTGKIHCLQEEMSAYRYITSGNSSWSSKLHKGEYLWQIYGFLIHREVETMAKKLGIEFSYREFDAELYAKSILRIRSRRKPGYIGLVIAMVVMGTNRRYMVFHGTKMLWNRIKKKSMNADKHGE